MWHVRNHDMMMDYNPKKDAGSTITPPSSAPNKQRTLNFCRVRDLDCFFEGLFYGLYHGIHHHLSLPFESPYFLELFPSIVASRKSKINKHQAVSSK